MSPKRACLVSLVLLAACHRPAVSPVVARPPAAAPNAVPVTPKPEGVDDDELFEKADLEHREELEEELVDLAKKAKAPPDRAAVPVTRWDKKTRPKNLDRIVEHLGMTAGERAKLEANGFVAIERLSHKTYATAFHRVHEEELPLFVGVDSILHALFHAHEAIMMMAEEDAQRALFDLLTKLRTELANAKGSYPTDVARDADLYLAVADRLLQGEGAKVAPPAIATQADVDALVTRAEAAKGLERVSLFGRDRLVDFGFFEPRGPYVRAGLANYFRAMVWLTRVEMNLVSRGGQSSAPIRDPRETPREATLSLVLTDLVKRTGTMTEIARLEHLYGALAGPSEAIAPRDLERLGQGVALGDVDAAAASLRAAIGDGFKRTVNYHPRTFTTPELPAIATFFGVGITPDAPALRLLGIPGDPRVIRGPDVAFALGVDRARAYVGADAQPLLAPARATVGKRTGPDLYAAWLGAVRAVGKPIAGTLPSFAETPAFSDTRVATAMIGYGQIRHAYALHGVQVYDEGGCKIPDAYVDPAVDVYEAILGYAKSLRGLRNHVNDPEPIDHLADALDLYVGTLLAIAKDELAGRPLTQDQKDFLALVVEHERPSAYAMRRTPLRNGWYEHLFAGHDAFALTPFVADYATNVQRGAISYLGARAPVMGVFVVDVGGEPRAMVGPVGRAVEWVTPLGKRMTDENGTPTFLTRPAGAWEASYLARAPAQPNVDASANDKTTVDVHSPQAIDVVVELVDEHSDTIARSAKVRVPKSEDGISVTVTPLAGMEDREVRRTRIRLPDGSVLDPWTNW